MIKTVLALPSTIPSPIISRSARPYVMASSPVRSRYCQDKGLAMDNQYPPVANQKELHDAVVSIHLRGILRHWAGLPFVTFSSDRHPNWRV